VGENSKMREKKATVYELLLTSMDKYELRSTTASWVVVYIIESRGSKNTTQVHEQYVYVT
jgi:hypothetical protein